MIWGISWYNNAELGLFKSTCGTVRHLCMLSLIPAQERSYWELLRDSHAEAEASLRETDCPGRYRTCVCMWWQEGQQELLAKAQRWGRAPHPLPAPGPTSCQGTTVLFSQVHCAGVEANFTSLPAKPGVMLVQCHRGRAPLLSWNWELNAALGAAAGHAELSLFKGLGCVSGPRESLNHRQWKQF